MIRIDAVWLAVAPMDMPAVPDTALARVVAVFGSAQPHHAYVFANARATRMKVLVHDGLGLWLAARRLHNGKFNWASGPEPGLPISSSQLNALVLGLPWQRVGHTGAITLV